MNVVRKIPQPDLDLRPNLTDCSENKVSGYLSLNSKNMFYPTPYPRACPVTPLLPISHLLVPASLSAEDVPNTRAVPIHVQRLF